jgi:hypothetical protein
MNTQVRFKGTTRNLHLLAAAVGYALISQSCFPMHVEPTRPTHIVTPSQTPLPFGETNLQIARLSQDERIPSENAQVLADPQGGVSVFWVEPHQNEEESVLFYKQRLSDGSWLESEEWFFTQFKTIEAKLVRGENQEICLTFFEENFYSVMSLMCKTDSGWEISKAKGYARPTSFRMSMIVDGPVIHTAYADSTDTGEVVLLFDGKEITDRGSYVADFDMVKYSVDAYYLVYTEKIKSTSEYTLTLLASDDRGKTWAPSILSKTLTESPRFLVGQDGVLYLFWYENKAIMFMHRSLGADWQRGEIDLDIKDAIWIDEIFLGEDSRGDLHIIPKTSERVYWIHGSVSRGFSHLELIWDFRDAGNYISRLSFDAGSDGTLYFAWESSRRGGLGENSAYFGLLPPRE